VRVPVLLTVAVWCAAACHARQTSAVVLAQTSVTDPRYQGLLFLVATVQRSGPDFIITNDSTQPWFDVTVALAGAGPDEYQLHLDQVDAGQSVTATARRFATPGGRSFSSQRAMPSTLIVSAEIGEGGPTGVYAVRL
jgi:hypothetical protein